MSILFAGSHALGWNLMGNKMKIWKIAVLVALATIPLLLMNKKKDLEPVCGDSDNIFENELTAD